MVSLKGEQVLLRPLEQEDLDFLYQLENNTATWKVSNTLSPYSRFALEQYLQSIEDIFVNKQLRLVIVQHTTYKAIGCIDLFDFDPHHQRAGIGIYVEEAFRNQGIATEALQLLINYCFQVLLLHQVYCNVGVNNQQSLKLFEQAGFSKCGLKKNWIRTGPSTFEDEWTLQLIQPEE